jgi:hypothetical protein
MTTAVSRIAPFAISIALIACLSGCCSIDSGRFDAFSGSTRDLLQGADIESAQIAEVQRTFLIFSAAAGKLDEHSFEQTVTVGGHEQNIDLVRQFNERIAILQAIAHYADALTAFAKKDYQSGVDSASTKLDGSISNLSKMGAGSGATTAAGYLATAVDALGHVIIEYQRVKGLQRAMSLAQPGLQTLAGLLVTGDELIDKQIEAYRKDILNDANATIASNPGGFDRVEIAALLVDPVSDASLSIGRLAELNRGIALLPIAHQELSDSMCSSTSTLSNLKEFVSEGQRVAKFHAGLN